MKAVNYLMSSWNLEAEADKIPDGKLKQAITAFIKLNKCDKPYMNMAGIYYRNNLQYILEHIDKIG